MSVSVRFHEKDNLFDRAVCSDWSHATLYTLSLSLTVQGDQRSSLACWAILAWEWKDSSELKKLSCGKSEARDQRCAILTPGYRKRVRFLRDFSLAAVSLERWRLRAQSSLSAKPLSRFIFSSFFSIRNCTWNRKLIDTFFFSFTELN